MKQIELIKMRFIARKIVGWHGHDRGVLHYIDQDNENYIKQINNNFYWELDGRSGSTCLYLHWIYRLMANSRLLARLFRLDRGSVCLVGDKIYAFYNYRMHVIDSIKNKSKCIHIFQFRAPLHTGISPDIRENGVYFGEYVTNWEGRSIKIYRCNEKGVDVMHVFSEGEIFHVHSVCFNRYDNCYYVSTGDFQGQCFFYVFDDKFNFVERLGDGSQVYRAVSIIFREEGLYWGMDSPLEDSYICFMKRDGAGLRKIHKVDGPIWYGRDLECQSMVFQVSAEKSSQGARVCRTGSVVVSDDGEKWQEIYNWQKDRYPNKYFRHGVISFPAGRMYKNSIVLQGDALRELDGEIVTLNQESK